MGVIRLLKPTTEDHFPNRNREETDVEKLKRFDPDPD
jgi:hypothetical protein